MLKVVHITAHLGGGIGRVLSSLAIYSLKKKRIEHVIITLEKTQNEHFEKICLINNIHVYLAKECDFNQIINDADIVQLDWWHHPLMSEFMVKYLGNIKCRLVLWSHVSGITYPFIPYDLINYADEFIFSAPYSLENKHWSKEQLKSICNKSNVIVSSGLDVINNINKKKHNEFNVGYIGFLGYEKMNPEYIKFCEAVKDIYNICFIVAGDVEYGKKFLEDVEQSPIKNKLKVKGYITDVNEYFQKIDVLGYILNSDHYGTAENVLLEAMAAGVVPVVLNQGCEKYIVEDGVTGLIVNNIDEYRKAILFLYNNPDKREELGKNAALHVIEKYHISKTILYINKIYDRLMNQSKRLHNAEAVLGTTPYEWFKSCYRGELHNIKGTAMSDTKGSILHYFHYYKEDAKLKEIIEINNSKINKEIK